MTRALLVLVAVVASGCGSRCKDVAAARTALTSRIGVPNRGADVRVTIPMAKANTVIAELLAQKPMSVPLDPPDLGPIQVTTTLTATVKQLTIVPGTRGHVRVVAVVDIDDPTGQVTAIDAIAEIEPELTRANGGAVLAIGIGPQNVLKMKPRLSPAAKANLGSAVTRWMPANMKNKLPQALVDMAAGKLGEHLTGVAWSALQKTLFLKLGELTAVKLRLPDVPVGGVTIQSLTGPDALVIEVATDLPARAGLAPATVAPPEMSVQIAGSVAAELANWAIDKGHAPQWYTRSLEPNPKGEFRPRFDYVPGTSHPLKVYAFQERGGCSYFKVGVAAKIEMSGDKLKATATDREIEAMNANIAIEAAAWTKYFLVGWVNKSKKVAAHTQLTIGGRALVTEVVSAQLAADELAFGLQLSGNPQATALNGSGMSRPSAGSSGGIKNSSR
jgi:hypothetical protein